MDRNQTRVDLPHLVHTRPALKSPPDHGLLLELAGHTSNEAEFVERQAQQLGLRLNEQQRDLDRREAEFNARAARMENELRTARLVYREREFKILEKQREFESRLTEMRQRNADMVAAQSALESEAHVNRIRHHQQLDESRLSVEEWQKRLRAMENDEKQLKQRMDEIEATKVELDSQRELLAQREKSLQEAESSDEAYLREIAVEREKLAAKSEELERRHVAVRQLHGDVSKMYREGLEIRISTEEVWGEMTEANPAGEISTRVSEYRSQLTQEYQIANQKLAEQQVEIKTLIERLALHESRLTQQRDEVRGWVSRRQQEIGEQANRLLEREQELDRQGTNLRHFERQWQKDRESLEHEIQRLRNNDQQELLASDS